MTANNTASTIARIIDRMVSSRVTTTPEKIRSSRMYLPKVLQPYASFVAAP